MPIQIHASWEKQLLKELQSPYFDALMDFVHDEYDKYSCYPSRDKIYAAFNHTPFEEVKVVLIGQDPYHGAGQANGLCFSVSDGIAVPPSLQNIYKELKTDFNKNVPVNGNLEHWAKQGVLLLNATLTVRAHEAGSHQKKGWEQFTSSVIKTLSEKHDNLVFLLWGGFAKKKGAKIDTSKHLVLTSGHPSPLSANRGYWFGNRHFSKTNEYLLLHGKTPIAW